MQLVKDWVMNIIVIMIFITVLDAMVPGSSYKKYIDMVAGLVIIIAIISPAVKLIKGGDLIQKEVLSSTAGLKSEEMANDNAYIKVSEDVFVEQYKKNMEETIRQWIDKRYDTDVERVSIDFDSDIDDTERFGYIKKVEVYIGNVDEGLSEKIAEDISSFYNVDKANISIIG